MTDKPADHILDEFLAKHGVTVALPEFSEVLGKLRAAMLAEAKPASRHWWICTNWLSSIDGSKPGERIAGPFRDQDEALLSRERIESYTGGRTFHVDSEADQ